MSALNDPYQITMEEACRRFPEAMVLFDVQCTHLLDHRPDIIRLRTYGKKGTYVSGEGGISRDRLGAVAGHLRAIWHANPGVWVRMSCGFAARPYVSPVPQSVVQTIHCVATGNGWHTITGVWQFATMGPFPA